MRKPSDINHFMYNFIGRLQLPENNRHYIIGFLFISLDICGFLPLISIPFSPAIFWAGIFPIVLVNLWGIVCLIAPYKFERAFYLFIGVLGFVTTYTYFLVIQKFFYIHIGIEHSSFFFFGFFALIALLLFFQLSYYRVLKKQTVPRIHEKGAGINLGPIVTMSSFGYIITQLLMSSFVTDSFQLVILSICLSALSVFTAFLSLWIQKYFFIKRHYDTVKRLRPNFNCPKQERYSKKKV